MNLTCKLYQLLYRLIPIKQWQSFLTGTHFTRCAACREMFEDDVDENISRLVISPQQAETSTSLWPGVREGIQAKQELMVLPVRRRWQLTAAAAAAVTAAVVLVISFLLQNGTPGDLPGNGINRPTHQIAVQSAKLQGQPAHAYIFNSKDPEMTMVWVEKNGRGQTQKQGGYDE